MVRTLRKTTIYILCMTLLLSLSSAFAANIYVNSKDELLGKDITTAYVVGAGGSVEMASDTYVLTGSGTVKLGETSAPVTPVAPEVPGGEDDGTTISTKYSTVRVGLKYASSALESANLQNEVGWGYEFGYYDESRVFHMVGSTNENKITMTPYGSGRGVAVTVTGTSTVLYTHTNAYYNLAVHPVSTDGDAVTWFKGYTYYGDFEYFRYDDKGLTVINVLSIDDYVKCVVPYEMTYTWPIEALKAQAVCARSYFAANVNSSYAKYGFDVTSGTSSQAYGGTANAKANSNAAVEATKGEYLTYDGKICNAVYSSSSGGGTENSENVFSAALGYCRGVIDPFSDEVPESMNSYKAWTREWTGEQLAAKTGGSIGTVVSVTPTYSDTNNVIALKLTDANGKSYTFTKDQCRTSMGLPSIHYTIEASATTPGSFTIKGGGWGHNVGMSQFGAYAMAQYHGYNYRQILRFYYQGASISKSV